MSGLGRSRCRAVPNATNLHAHSLDIIETVDKTLEIAAMPQLVAGEVLLEDGVIGIVVGRIAIR